MGGLSGPGLGNSSCGRREQASSGGSSGGGGMGNGGEGNSTGERRATGRDWRGWLESGAAGVRSGWSATDLVGVQLQRELRSWRAQSSLKSALESAGESIGESAAERAGEARRRAAGVRLECGWPQCGCRGQRGWRVQAEQLERQLESGWISGWGFVRDAEWRWGAAGELQEKAAAVQTDQGGVDASTPILLQVSQASHRLSQINIEQKSGAVIHSVFHTDIRVCFKVISDSSDKKRD